MDLRMNNRFRKTCEINSYLVRLKRQLKVCQLLLNYWFALN